MSGGAAVRITTSVVVLALVSSLPMAAELSDPPTSSEGYVKLGAFHLRPALALKNVGYDSNIFLTETDTVSDVTATLVPALEAVTLFGHRARLDLLQSVDLVYYLDITSQNHINSLTDIKAEVLLGDFLYQGNLVYDTSRIRPSNEIDERVRQEIGTVANAFTWSRDERNELGVEIKRKTYSYEDGASAFGTFYTDLDRDELTGAILASTQVRPKTDLTLEIAHTDITHDRAELDRDAVINRVVPGLRFDASAFFEGELRLGFMEFKPDDSSHASYRGPTGDANISYRPLARLRLQADYRRDVVFSIFGDNLFFVEERFGLQASVPISHRFRLAAGATRSTFDYREAVSSTDFSGLRQDEVDQIWVGWSYALPGRPRVGFRVVRWDRDSNFEPAVTSQYRVMGEARYAF